MPELPQVQRVEQNKPVDLSGQSKKALEIKSTIAEIKSPIAKSGVFTKMHETMIQMERHLQKIRDFGAAKTDVKFNEKTNRWHSPLNSNKMVKGVDDRVVAVKEKAQEEALEEDALRAKKLPEGEMVTTPSAGLGTLAGFLKDIAGTTKEHLDLYKKEVGGDAEKDLEDDTDKKKKEADDKKGEEKKEGLLDGIKKAVSESKLFGFFKDNWGKILIAIGLLFLPLKDLKKWAVGLFNFVVDDLWPALKEIGQILLDVAVPALRMIFGAIGSMVDFFLGKRATEEEFIAAKEKGPLEGESQKDFDARLASMGSMKDGKFEAGDRLGGVFGKGGGTSSLLQMFGVSKETADKISSGLSAFAIAIGAGLSALTMMFPITMVKTFAKGLASLGKGLWKGVKSVGNMFKTKPVGGKPPNWDKMSKTEKAKFNKAQQTKIDAKAKGGKPGAPKTPGGPKASITSKPTSSMSTKPSGTPKAPKGGGGSKLADTGKKMGKWAKKFPKLAKSMKFLTKIPFVGKLFLAGPLIYALASGAGKKEIAPIIGQILGGVGGAMLGGMLGTLVGVAGGPLALVTGALGGIAGAMVGDTLGTALAQWLVGEKVDAFGWGFGWINDIINGGKGPKEETASGGGGVVKDEGPPPMTKMQFLQSDKYKDQMKDDKGVVRGESSAGKQMAYDDYLKELELPAMKQVQHHIKRFDGAKSLQKFGIKQRMAKDLAAANEEDREMMLAELKGTKLGKAMKQSYGDDMQPTDLSKVKGAEGMTTSTGGLDMTSDAFSAHVSPGDKASDLNAIHAENAGLKGQQADGGSTLVNSPSSNVTNNNGSNVVLASNTAQGGMSLGALME